MKLTPAEVTNLHLGAHEGTGPAFVDPDAAAQLDKGNPIDDLRSGLKVWADLGITLGGQVEAHMALTRSLLQRLDSNTPVDYSCVASGVYPSSGYLTLQLGSPDQGTYWEVQSVAAGGTDQNVSALGTAGLYVSAGFTGTSPGMGNLIDQATSLPNVGFYGGRQCWVGDQENLILCIYGGTAGQTYVANAQVAVFNVASARGKVSNYT